MHACTCMYICMPHTPVAQIHSIHTCPQGCGAPKLRVSVTAADIADGDELTISYPKHGWAVGRLGGRADRQTGGHADGQMVGTRRYIGHAMLGRKPSAAHLALPVTVHGTWLACATQSWPDRIMARPHHGPTPLWPDPTMARPHHGPTLSWSDTIMARLHHGPTPPLPDPIMARPHQSPTPFCPDHIIWLACVLVCVWGGGGLCKLG